MVAPSALVKNWDLQASILSVNLLVRYFGVIFMSKFIIGKKINMTQIWSEDGRVIPATLIEAGPVVVTQVKDVEKDGYKAVQIGFGTRNPKNIKKPQRGHFKKLGNFSVTKEFKIGENDKYSVGDTISASIFELGDKVSVSSNAKGKGFQGVVKRHGFHGGPRTHGQKHSEREPGSIGATGPQRVFKGMRMAGRMGGKRVTTRGLTVVGVDEKSNQMLIKGAIPGRRGTLIEIRGANFN